MSDVNYPCVNGHDLDSVFNEDSDRQIFGLKAVADLIADRHDFKFFADNDSQNGSLGLLAQRS